MKFEFLPRLPAFSVVNCHGKYVQPDLRFRLRAQSRPQLQLDARQNLPMVRHDKKFTYELTTQDKMGMAAV
jgi:hypothetical protein